MAASIEYYNRAKAMTNYMKIHNLWDLKHKEKEETSGEPEGEVDLDNIEVTSELTDDEEDVSLPFVGIDLPEDAFSHTNPADV